MRPHPKEITMHTPDPFITASLQRTIALELEMEADAARHALYNVLMAASLAALIAQLSK